MAPNLSSTLERELGNATGGLYAHGYPFDSAEPSGELQWPQSVLVFDQMRRQDAQVSGVFRAVTLPIRQAKWVLDPNGAKHEVVQLVADDLSLPVLGEPTDKPKPRQRDRFSFDEHLRMALLSLAYGHMPFEQVYRIVDGKARLRKLAPRMPRTIAKINVATDGGLEGIEQYGLTGQTPMVKIPVSRLAWYVNEREAGNWQGLSIFRSAYKHWLLKDRLIRVGAMTVERNGMGVPIVDAPQGATPQQIAELNKLAQGYRAGEFSGGALPYGGALHLRGVEGTLPDALPQIAYHDKQIATNILAQFLELAHSAHGSRAVASSFIDFFQMALDAISGQMASTLNEFVVEDLVDLNWGENEPAPRVTVAPVNADKEIPPESIVALIEAGAIEVDDDLEAFLRSTYQLPARNMDEPPRVPPKAAQVAASRRRRVMAAKGKAWTNATARRDALYERFRARQRAAIGKLDVDVASIVDATVAAKPAQVSAALDPTDAALTAAATEAARNALGEASDAQPMLRAVTADAIREGQAEGETGARGLLAQRDSISLDFDMAFEEAMSAMSDYQGLLDAAEPWVAKQLEALGADIGSQVAKLVAQGATNKQMTATVESVLAEARGAWLFLDNVIASSLTEGALDLYSSEGVGEVDFLSAEDDRVDEDCAEAEGQNPWPIDGVPQPPLHLNCRCVVAVPES